MHYSALSLEMLAAVKGPGICSYCNSVNWLTGGYSLQMDQTPFIVEITLVSALPVHTIHKIKTIFVCEHFRDNPLRQLPPKFADSVSMSINKHSFESFMCLDLVLECQQSFLLQIYFSFSCGRLPQVSLLSLSVCVPHCLFFCCCSFRMSLIFSSTFPPP